MSGGIRSLTTNGARSPKGSNPTWGASSSFLARLDLYPVVLNRLRGSTVVISGTALAGWYRTLRPSRLRCLPADIRTPLQRVSTTRDGYLPTPSRSPIGCDSTGQCVRHTTNATKESGDEGMQPLLQRLAYSDVMPGDPERSDGIPQ